MVGHVALSGSRPLSVERIRQHLCEPRKLPSTSSPMASPVHWLQLNTLTPSPALLTPQTLNRRSPKSVKCRRNRSRGGFVACRSALVGEQQEASPFIEPETQLIEALIGIQGRGRSATPQQLQDVQRAVEVLETLGGVPEPTSSGLIEGRWQLMFTTRPKTASPIQRTFVGVDVFSVFQEIYLRSNDPRVSNIVVFSEAIGELKVEAAASISNGKRILFRFDRAAFSLKFLPFKVPYPVPFRLLGDEAKGWLDTTYLSESGNLRISRGNKGTTFVLQKLTEPRQLLLSAISTGKGIEKAIDEITSSSKNKADGELELVEGEWNMIWSSQMETDSWIENAANGLMGTQIVKKSGQIKLVVNILPGLRFSMNGTSVKCCPNTYDVTMDDAAIIGGPFGYPVEMETKFKLELLYTDDKIRISRGYNNIVFVHLRVDGTK